MVVQQISVFLENKAGRLASVAQALKDSSINIRALTVADSSDFGILRMIVNKPDDALKILKEAGFMVKLNPVLAVEIEDREGLFFEIMKLCDQEHINVEYTYSFVEQYSNKAILFLRFDDTERAVDLFIKNKYKLLGPKEVSKL
ncbi:ACT domain-containing protein [Chitinispirillales bacterium ANBcel5]|uniref:ACT domain-containing protein n=1 Tax=Cellulosispirillum alkaliphilum TaxID=3039283 RepID=UPI002A53837C|nr:ACT domain-containing protein [Chitinispirillales bacterium ANBcel5]